MKIFNNIQSIQLPKSAVITIGNFDGIHFGHKNIISHVCKKAREVNAESLLITFWPHPRMVLQPDRSLKILTTKDEKTEILEKTGLSAVLYLPFDNALANMPYQEFISEYLVKKLKVNRIVLGYNHQFGKNREGNYNNVLALSSQYGYEVDKLGPYEKNGKTVSSSLIRNLLINGSVTEANEFLDHDYFITGTIVRGDKIGQQLGYPTANIQLSAPNKLIPKTGVYAAYIMFEEKLYKGMLNIGYRPTVNASNNELKIEVNLFDFNKEIYGKELKIYFKQRIRDEKKFDSLHQLKEQLYQDKLTVLSNLSLN